MATAVCHTTTITTAVCHAAAITTAVCRTTTIATVDYHITTSARAAYHAATIATAICHAATITTAVCRTATITTAVCHTTTITTAICHTATITTAVCHAATITTAVCRTATIASVDYHITTSARTVYHAATITTAVCHTTTITTAVYRAATTGATIYRSATAATAVYLSAIAIRRRFSAAATRGRRSFCDDTATAIATSQLAPKGWVFLVVAVADSGKQAVPTMTEPEAQPCPSAALQAANARLLALRAAAGQRPTAAAAVGPTPLGLKDVLNYLPAHLGWHSAAATAALRRGVPKTAVWPTANLAAQPRPQEPETASIGHFDKACAGSAKTAVCPPDNEALKLYPSLALALLQAGQTAPGRLWLLLRFLDENGRGCLPLHAIRARLTKGDSPTRLCGQRQLRALLQQGHGLFWQRDKTHVWLASTVKVAAALGVVRLRGRPIALPLAVLLEPIGLVRAHLYASFHSSRLGEAGEAAPISREALTAVSGVCRRTQHAYEDRAGVRVQANIALGAPLSQNSAAAEEAAWQHGRAAFVLTDIKGKQGKPGQRYLAWRLPNSYSGAHALLGHGRQRHLNRQLADLRRYGDAGNGRFGGCSLPEDAYRGRRYTANGALARRSLRHQPDALVYWRGRGECGECGAVIWYVLASAAGFG